VKLVKLEVANFRGIRAASIAFSSGFNVLHGPNDLGKSTLAEAIRAALLVPTNGKEGRSYVAWDVDAPAQVKLTFESSGKLWRVRKTFGSDFESVLDQSEKLDSPQFHEFAHGRGVEGELRKLLSWGIVPPGGKGQAAAELKDQRAAHDLLVKETASTKTQFEVARQQSDPDGLHQLRQQLDGLPSVDTPPKSVADAKASLDQAKNEASEASARVTVLHDQLSMMQPKVAQLVLTVGEDPSVERQKATAHLAAIDQQLKSLESTPREGASSDIKAVADAQQKRADFEAQVAIDEQALKSATAALSEADGAVARLGKEVASKQGELKAIDRVALEAKRQAALDDPVFHVTDAEGISVASAVEALEIVKRKLEDCDGRLNAAKGQLHLIAGHVGAKRLAQQEEAVKYARDEVLDREQTEAAALRLLNEIRSVEAARTSHLGRTLAGPITNTFRALTGGRYGQLALDPDLKTENITAVGSGRDLSDLSVGTREQLATLIRLAIAGHLQTALLLDDQLVHSDPERLNWFRQQLRASAERGHQVIVFTCRPADYFPLGTEVSDNSTSVVDLASAISRSNTLTT
jgi:DNA repair exonuclease SbcCD ATPase subunit